jgi:hypothetical protein
VAFDAEQVVALTDVGLALEAAVLAVVLARDRATSRWWSSLFAAIAVASLAGAMVHGTAWFGATAWIVTLLAVGVVAVATAMLAVVLARGPEAARRAGPALGLALAGYAAAVVCGARSFRLALLAYVPAVLGLLVAVVGRRRAPGGPRVVVALVISVVAATVQATATTVPLLPLAPNALYHVIQAVALLLLASGARGLHPKGDDRADST